jgi:hypothetical protein
MRNVPFEVVRSAVSKVTLQIKVSLVAGVAAAPWQIAAYLILEIVEEVQETFAALNFAIPAADVVSTDKLAIAGRGV